MRNLRTIFEHDTEPTHYWVQCRPFINNRQYHLTLRLTKNGTEKDSNFEITDFRAPSHPGLNWSWIDINLKTIWQAIEFVP